MIKKILSQLNMGKKKRGRAKRALAVLSAIAVFFTTYSLILPAITIDKDAAENEPGLDVVNTAEDGNLLSPDSLPGDVTDAVSRSATCAGLTVGAELTDGFFDEGVVMSLTAISDEDILQAAVDAVGGFREAEQVRAVEISFEDENGDKADPDAPLNLTLSGEAIADAADPVVVRIDGDGNAEEAEGRDYGELVYLEEESSPIYAIVETHEITTRYISADGSNYRISVAYDAQANIPDDAELSVSEIEPESEEYQGYLAQASEKLPENRSAGDARFFDISIISNGEEIEPASEVSVMIEYEQPLELGENSEVLAVHFTEDGALLNSEVETSDGEDGGSKVCFKQDSFSITGTLVSNINNLKNGAYYAIVAENNGKYYALTNTGGTNAIAQEVEVFVSGNTVTIGDQLPDSYLWTYSTTNNNSKRLKNNSSNQYINLSRSGVCSSSAGSLTLENGSNAMIRIKQGNYYLYYNTSSNSFSRSGSSTQYYIIEYGEYTIQFHYVDGDGNEISDPVDHIMGYSESAVDLTSEDYAIPIEGYNFQETRYAEWWGDRVKYLQNQKTSTGSGIIINLKTEAMYQANTSNVPVTENSNKTNVVDSVDLTSKSDHKIDVYMVYSPEDAPDPNEVAEQHGSELPASEFPFGAPDHNKRLVPNYTDGHWDGTYTLYLDVTGKAASVKDATKADVILIYDTSNSMDKVTENTRVRRYQVAYDVVTDVAEQLFAYNKAGDAEPNVRVAMISYASSAKQEFGYVDSLSAFNSGFAFAKSQSTYQKSTYGGTNWEDALQLARQLYDSGHREDANQYVVFISDGEPTCRATKGDYYQIRESYEYDLSNNGVNPFKDGSNGNRPYYEMGYGSLSNGKYYYTGVEHAYTYAKDDARSFVDAGANFFTVGIFNDRDTMWHMNTLANYAYTGYEYTEITNNRYKYAENATVMHDVFDDIVQQITKNFGYGEVEIQDVMTATALTTGDLIEHAADFKYYKNPAGGTLTEWSDAPQASYNTTDKKVDWDLSSIGMLEEGVTYTVGFTVWPNQESYDTIMLLNDLIDTGMSPAQVDAYAQQHYPDIFPLLRRDSTNHYIVQSNADAELKYERFIVENDGEPQSLGVETAGYSYPNMETTKYYMNVSKSWKDHLQDTNRFRSVIFDIYEDYDETPGAINVPYATVTLDASKADPNDPYRWTDQIEISPGIVKTEINGTTPINPGHSYRVFEVGYTDKFGAFHDVHDPSNYNDYRYEFIEEEVVPMLYDGNMVCIGDTDGDNELTGTNNLRGGLNLCKKVIGRDGLPIYTEDEYEFIFRINIPERFIIGYEDGEPVYDPNAYPLWYTVYTDVDRDGNFFGENDTNAPLSGRPATDDGWDTIEDGDHIKLRSDQMLRMINVPVDSQYSFQEINVPKGWEFDHATIEVNGQIVKNQIGPDPMNRNILIYNAQADASHDNIFYNRMTHYEVKVHKVDASNRELALPDAVFEIYSAPGMNPSDIVTINGQTRFTTDQNGDISLGYDLPNGTYYLYEVTAPPGYKRFTEPVTVTVSDSGVTYTQPQLSEGGEQTAPLSPGTDASIYTVTVINEPNEALQIIKINAEDPETTLQGAIFNLYMLPEGAQEEDPVNIDHLDIVTIAGETDLTTDAQGVIFIPDGLPPGVYYLYETTAPSGFVLSKDPVKINVADTGIITYIQKDYHAGQLTTAQLSSAGDSPPILTIYVANNTGYELPHTGGAGLWLYTASGITLVCIALTTIVISKRRRRERGSEKPL